MNYFLDTEFTNLPWIGDVELISIALVREDGDSYYACCKDFDRDNLSEFVKSVVIPLLPNNVSWKYAHEIRTDLLSFFSGVPPTALWSMFPTEEQLLSVGLAKAKVGEVLSQYSDIDCQLLRRLMGCSYKQEWPETGSNLVPVLSKLEQSDVSIPVNSSPHDALADASWGRQVWLAAADVCRE